MILKRLRTEPLKSQYTKKRQRNLKQRQRSKPKGKRKQNLKKRKKEKREKKYPLGLRSLAGLPK